MRSSMGASTTQRAASGSVKRVTGWATSVRANSGWPASLNQAAPAGPWDSVIALLESGALARAGIREVCVAGFPEGHPHLPAGGHFELLERKQRLAADQGITLEVVTQFSLSPTRVTEYCSELFRAAPSLPVYAGIAGPAPEHMLRHYARTCGVSASLRALDRLGVKAVNEALHLRPDEQLAALAHHCAARESSNVIGLHLYCFGGFDIGARWIAGQLRTRVQES